MPRRFLVFAAFDFAEIWALESLGVGAEALIVGCFDPLLPPPNIDMAGSFHRGGPHKWRPEFVKFWEVKRRRLMHR